MCILPSEENSVYRFFLPNNERLIIPDHSTLPSLISASPVWRAQLCSNLSELILAACLLYSINKKGKELRQISVYFENTTESLRCEYTRNKRNFLIWGIFNLNINP